MSTPNIDKLIDDAIDALADDNPNVGAECMVELARAFAECGFTQESFNNLRTYIVNAAKTHDQCPALIDTKLKQSEQLLQRARNGESSIIYFH